MTDELLANIERFEKARDELRATISEAHSAVKDVRIAVAEAHKQVQSMRENFEGDIGEKVTAFVGGHLDAMGPALKLHMDRSVDHVLREFKKLERSLFKGPNGIDLRDVAAMMGENNQNPLREVVSASKRKPSGKRVGQKIGTAEKHRTS